MWKRTKEKTDRLLDYIKTYFMENGTVPTIRQIQKDLEIKSTSTVFFYLEHLEEEGKIKKIGKTYVVTGFKITFDE